MKNNIKRQLNFKAPNGRIFSVDIYLDQDELERMEAAGVPLDTIHHVEIVTEDQAREIINGS